MKGEKTDSLFCRAKKEIAGVFKIVLIVLVILLVAAGMLYIFKNGLSFVLDAMCWIPIIGAQSVLVRAVLLGLILILMAVAIKIKRDKLEKRLKHLGDFEELSYLERKSVVIGRLSEILLEEGYTKVVIVRLCPGGIKALGFTHGNPISEIGEIPIAVPNSPMPATGFTLFVSPKDYSNPEIIKQAKITVEKALEIIVSFGFLGDFNGEEDFKKFEKKLKV